MRGTYGPDQPYTEMAARALKLWAKYERRWKQQFLHRTGVLWMAPGHDDAFERGSIKSLRAAKIKFHELSAAQMKQTPDNKSYFPDAEDQDQEDAFRKLDWENRPAADEAARKSNHTESDQTYRLKQLLDRASLFAGTLCMGLVNFDTVDASKKDAAAAIFQDWNLEYQTVDQWNDLMETNSSGKPGLIKSIETWWKNLNQQPPQPTDANMMERIATAFGMTAADAVRPS